MPLKVPFCEALEQRLDPKHHKYPVIKSELGSYFSGYLGEKSLDYHLSTLSPKKYHIFHGLVLKNDTYYFRIDTLLITAYYAFILEVKNYSDELLLDTPLNQLIQTKATSRAVYPRPILQAQRQQYELQTWLQSHHYSKLPVTYIVVFTNRKAFLKSYPGDEQIFKNICKSPDLKNRVEKLNELLSEEQVNEKEIKKLGKRLLSCHIPTWSYTLLAEYKIDSSEILYGVQCPSCKNLGMNYQKRSWVCSGCHTRSKTAHERAIRDYFF
jgi:hypothetical protein